MANSFAIPFEEDEKDSKTWFLDHNYIEGMYGMFKKVNGECVVVCAVGLWLDGLCSEGTYDWMVPHGSEAEGIGSGD